MPTGEVRDVRTRNRTLKIVAAAIALLILLAIIGILLYFFVFANNDDEPHLEFVPAPENGNLIKFKANDREEAMHWVDLTNEFLKGYLTPPSGTKTQCRQDYIKANPDPNVPCAIDVNTLADGCSMKNGGFGYLNGAPCVIVKLNKILDFVPEPFDNLTEAEELNMPKELVQYIRVLNDTGTAIGHRQMNTTWVTCEGDGDIGHVNYYFPGFRDQSKIFAGIPNMYFPYLDQDAYVEPFLFVKLIRPPRNVTVSVTCRAWAKNIDPEKGSVNFELFIEV